MEKKKPLAVVEAMPPWRYWQRWYWFPLVLVLLVILAAGLLVALEVLGGSLLRKPVGHLVSGCVGMRVEMARLDFNLFSWTPSAQVSGLTVGPKKLQGGPLVREPSWLEVSDTQVAVRLLPLLKGEVWLPYVRAQSVTVVLRRVHKDDSLLPFGMGGVMHLPRVETLSLTGGRLLAEDGPRQLRVESEFSAVGSNVQREKTLRQMLVKLEGRGLAQRQKFHFKLTGGSAMARGANAPYPLVFEMVLGTSGMAAQGRLLVPTNLLSFDGRVRVHGDDLSRLYMVSGVPLPNTPPYDISAQVTGTAGRLVMTEISGKFGDSDIAGSASLNLMGKRRMIEADLVTKQLDFDDLAAVLGAPPATGRGETASLRQMQLAARLKREQRLFPDAQLQVERLRQMDARVKYQADKVNMDNLPLHQMALTAVLKDGVLTLDPMELDVAGGAVAGKVVLDARKDMPHVTVDLTVRNMSMAQFFPANRTASATVPLQGLVTARIQLAGNGLSVRQVASHVNGEVGVAVRHGEMRRSFAELMGINVVRGLGLLLADNQDFTLISCAVADFKATDGVLRSHTVLLDTGPVLATGSGMVRLGDERMWIRLQGHPKMPRLGHLMVPVTISGPLRKPRVGLELAGSVAQLGGAALLGALLSPLAAVLPFLDPGLAQDADCGALLAASRGRGVPVGR